MFYFIRNKKVKELYNELNFHFKDLFVKISIVIFITKPVLETLNHNIYVY